MSLPPPATRVGWRALPVAAVALLAGFAVMVVELSAVRALAPSFGDSVPVWTNVIGVILLALALGAMAGGWCADRGMGPRLLPALLAAAGGAVFLIPALVPRVAAWILPESLPLDRALPVLVEGSLGVGLLVFCPPVLLLGAVSPILIQLGSRGTAGTVGRVSGVVYASGTIGSLFGTFLATHVLVPQLGLTPTFLVAGGTLLAAAGLSLLLGRRAPGAAWALAFVPMLGALLEPPPPVWLGDIPEGQLLAAQDSRYQRLWVVEGTEEVDGTRRKQRLLKINEGLDSFHSVWIEGTEFTNGRYYDTFALLPFLLPDQGEVQVLSLGCAGGSILRVVRAVLGERMRAVGVDIDPAVIELGHRWFRLPPPSRSLQLIGNLDARVYVERVAPDRRFHLICVDTYRNQFYLPAHLASVEFFRAVRQRLAPGGVLALNIGDFSPQGPVLSSVAGTLAAAFETVESFRVGGARNFLVFAHDRKPGLLAERLARARKPASLPEWLWEQGKRPGAYRRWTPLPPAELLTDARSSLGPLHERIYSRLDVGAEAR